MIAAMMTAANLGARITGWGFVVFVVGSLAWTTIGVSTGQTSLIVANAFLTLVNMVGIWRWLGREAKYQDSAEVVAEATEDLPKKEVLTPVSQLIGRDVYDPRGTKIANVVDAMLGCEAGHARALLVRHGGVGGVGERIVVLERFDLATDRVETDLDASALKKLCAVPA